MAAGWLGLPRTWSASGGRDVNSVGAVNGVRPVDRARPMDRAHSVADSRPASRDRPTARPAALRLALVGPTHPWRGGIALHTTALAHRLVAEGHAVRIESWCSQGPARLFPSERGRLTVPEATPFPVTSYPLCWNRPEGWWRLGRELSRQVDVVVLVAYTPLQVPALWSVARAARAGARVVVLCHNVLPHEPRPGDRTLMRLLLRGADGVVVHSRQERDRAVRLRARRTLVAALPPHLPLAAAGPARGPASEVRRHLLFFGNVRHYKGLDVLVRALAEVDGVSLTVAGEFFGGPGGTRKLVAELGLADRVVLRPGYVPAEQVADLFSTADALVLPYRSATATQNVALARRFGVPVLATRVGTLATLLRHDVDGLLCEPDDVAGLAGSIRTLYEPGRLDALRRNVAAGLDGEPSGFGELEWTTYLAALRAAVGHDLMRSGTRAVGTS